MKASSFGEWLAKRTASYGGQAKLAKALGVTPQTITKYVNQGTRPGPKILQAIAAYFGTSYLEVLSMFEPEADIGTITYGAIGSHAQNQPQPVSAKLTTTTNAVRVKAALITERGVWMRAQVTSGDDLQIAWPLATKSTYAFRISTDALDPRVRCGEFLILDPAATPQPGDEILVAATDGLYAALQLISTRNGVLSCQTISAERTPVTLQAASIVTAHVIVGIAKPALIVSPAG